MPPGAAPAWPPALGLRQERREELAVVVDVERRLGERPGREARRREPAARERDARDRDGRLRGGDPVARA